MRLLATDVAASTVAVVCRFYGPTPEKFSVSHMDGPRALA
jgi:hypothetical protein